MDLGQRGSADPITQMCEWQEKIAALPPVPHVIRGSHKVPYGTVWRMWDTKGRMIVYANRGELADLPRAPKSGARYAAFTDQFWPAFGIPVVYE